MEQMKISCQNSNHNNADNATSSGNNNHKVDDCGRIESSDTIAPQHRMTERTSRWCSS
jgi:hypothetical protein